MKRVTLAALLGVLIWLLAARMGVRQETVPAAAMDTAWDPQQYNVLDQERSRQAGTAGSALAAEADRYFLSRTPTARHGLTGSLAGKNLVLLLAEDWAPEAVDAAAAPTLYRLWDRGVHFKEFYAPDWYQGADGREFALLSGLTPTTVGDETAMAWVGGHNNALPFALARALAGEGYVCAAWPAGTGREASYLALGFDQVRPPGTGDIGAGLGALAEGGPFFVYWVLEGANGEPDLARLWQALAENGLAEDTAVCLVTGHTDPLRGHLFLYGPGLTDRSVTTPCSELDVTATLLDLFGAAYDARFLSGRDLFAPAEPGPPTLVALYGSAYSDWVSDAGSYAAGDGVFFPLEGRFSDQQTLDSYVSRMCREVYDRYAYARQALESDCFRWAAGG